VISIIVIGYEMQREIPRTLYSLSREYQRGVEDIDYEVIYIDNGTKPKPDRPEYCDEYIWIEDADPSPAKAANLGLATAKGDYIGVILDGARVVTPGIISLANRYQDGVVCTYSYHLGPIHQSRSVHRGYTSEIEDELLDDIDWPSDGYRLFEISVAAGSNNTGEGGMMTESCLLFAPRHVFNNVKGYDERYAFPGGGFLNLDIFYKLTRANCPLYYVRGEGTFHQVHGGISTGGDVKKGISSEWYKEYAAIRGTRIYGQGKGPKLIGQGIRWG